MSTLYNDLHKQHVQTSGQRSYSARAILREFLGRADPADVIDVGCGLGYMLEAAREAGLDTVGVEGVWIEAAEGLRVPRECILQADLEQPFKLERRFDLCVCLEVAEHLEPARAEGLVDDLCRLSDAVIFSAAIEGQGGTGHKNERWQDYWAELFLARGFLLFDPFRPRLRGDPRVSRWLRQNVLLFLDAGSPLLHGFRDTLIPIPAARMIDVEYHGRILERQRGIGRFLKRMTATR